jgi:uncharacterized protein (TIGR03382 family)
MKKLLLAIALAATTTFVGAQGTIQFPRLRIEYCLGTPAASPGALSFGVFAGPTADSLASQPILPLGTNAPSGFIGAPNQAVYALPGYEPGSTVFLQVRGWETRFGLDWQAGRQGGLYGETPVVQVTLGPAIGPGTVITSPGFGEIVMCVPEPSAITLAFLGLGALLLFRRRKQAPIVSH